MNLKRIGTGSLFLAIAALFFFTDCSNPQQRTADKADRLTLVPEPDKAERLKYEALQKLKAASCVLMDPDTSVCGIKLRNPESTRLAIGDTDSPDSIDEYHYYSALDNETLTLTQHPGDSRGSISVFRIEYSDKADHGYRQLKTGAFTSEKGIRLGMNKSQITALLGNCYVPVDSTKDFIALYYRLEAPQDSRTGLLKNNNMPVYYASYRFWNNRLRQFEFGFEYP